MIFMANGRQLGFTSPDGTINDFNTVNLLPLPFPVNGSPAKCVQRPACLDATPRCSLPEPAAGWCQPNSGTLVTGVSQEPPPLGTIMANGLPYKGGPISDYGGLMKPLGPPTVIVTPTSGAIPPPTVPPTPAPAANPIMDLLTGSVFGGIPNWVLGAAAALLLFHGEGK